MTDTPLHPPLPTTCLEQATDWLLTLAAEPERLEQFNHWLMAAPEHLDAWVQVNQVWGALAQQPATTQANWPITATATVLPLPRPKPRRWLPYAAAASLAALAITTLLSLSAGWRADYHTGTAQTREVQLEDGSHLTLAPQSAVDVRFENGVRQVTLLSGEVFFQVARDAGKPFQVNVAQVAVRVLGTAFDVRLDDRQVRVEVREGAVGVEGSQLPYRLSAGQALSLNRNGDAPTPYSVSADEVAAWASGKQHFENASVSEVVEQLRPYHRGWIAIDDPELANRRVTGLYDLRDPRRALEALAQPLDAHLAQYTPWVLVLRKK